MSLFTAAPERTYAVVVGVERYEAEQAWSDLDGPVQDALNFAAWLRSRGVPEANIHLFLAPLEQNEQLCEVWSRVQRPDSDVVRKEFTRTLRMVEGDLLYVFWGGHGIITSEQEHRRVFLADAHLQDPFALNLQTLLTFLRSDGFEPGFAQVVCFVDACAQDEHTAGFLTKVSDIPFPHGTPRRERQQFALYATRPGQLATNPDKSGLFSTNLLEELQQAPAEQWPPDYGGARASAARAI